MDAGGRAAHGAVAEALFSPLMQSTRTHSTIGLGFFAIAALFFAIVVIWLAMVSNHNANLRQLNRGEYQRQLVFAMRDAAHQRNLALFRMAALQDAFARDTEYLRFKESAGNFIAARQQLLDKYFDQITAEHWQSVKPLIQDSEKLQNAVVDLIMEDNNAAALSLIEQEFIPAQRRVSKELSRMLDSTRKDIANKLDTASAETQTHYQIILLLVLLATSTGYMIAKAVLRRNDEAHNVLLTKNQQIHALNDTTSDPRHSIEEQINNILQLGCEFLSMERVLLVHRAPDYSVTVLDRYPAPLAQGNLNEQDLVDKLQNSIGDTEILLATPASLSAEDKPLHEIMRTERITSIIAAPLKTTSSTEHFVVFFQSKNFQISDEANQLTQLLGNKLAVLLDQQETLSQLEHARLAAETANKAKSVFLANITDDLRTPLLRIMEHSESLHEKLHQHEHLEYDSELDVINESSQQLCTLISNLLDMIQLESASMKLERQSVDIQALLHDIETLLQPVITKNDNQFDSQTLDDLGSMHSDPGRIRQVLVNLLTFSAKLTAQGKITLTAWRESSPEDDWIYFEVKDTSNGISKKQLNHLFKMVITDSLDHDKVTISPEIQLAISKKICELLGGDILVDSKPNHGTTFTVCLPCKSQPQTSIASATA
jgi:signal transduction histidine kinase